MSLILDALRKLEREKEAREAPGVVVVGSVPWGETPKRRLTLVVAAATLAIAGVAGVLVLLRSGGREPGPPAERAAAPAPVVAASPAAAPLPPQAASPEPARDLPAAPPIRLSRPPELVAPVPASTADGSPTLPATRLESASAARATAAEAAREAEQPKAAAAAAEAPALPATAAPPAASGAAAPDGLRLSAISQRDGRPVALINDRLVFEGDSFDGIRVIRIGEAEVELEVRGERRVLRF